MRGRSSITMGPKVAKNLATCYFGQVPLRRGDAIAALQAGLACPEGDEHLVNSIVHMLCEVYVAAGDWKEAHDLLTKQRGGALPPDLVAWLAVVKLRLGPPRTRQQWRDSGEKKGVAALVRVLSQPVVLRRGLRESRVHVTLCGSHMSMSSRTPVPKFHLGRSSC